MSESALGSIEDSMVTSSSSSSSSLAGIAPGGSSARPRSTKSEEPQRIWSPGSRRTRVVMRRPLT